ncbi:ABC transporter permease [uncultured Modestobacter sp.]|uniref:ABC transporter permease n=1 Tax=uncultured Modestobacter sp. TaxID=380048 RepID=UPI002628DA2C|nr:ABC transporter permease [uncultured Modestobacter sp.]
MLKFISQRVLMAVPVLLLVSLFTFLLLDLLPGDAAVAIAGENATEEQIALTRERLGLDSPFLERFWNWVSSAAQGDLGTSLYTGQSVTEAIGERLPVTASLGLVALLMAVVVAIPLGAIAATRPGSLADRVVISATSLAMAVPPFVLGLVLVVVFAIQLQFLPATGYTAIAEEGLWGWLSHLILPAIAVAGIMAAELARQTRGALLDALSQSYVRTAKARGLRPPTVVGKHALKNAATPIVTVLALQIGHVLGAAVTVEFVFAIPGFGSLAVNAVNLRDVPLIQGVVFVSALVVLAANLLADVVYGYLNPKLRV